MSDRVEVLPGSGTVLRHGNVAIWAGPAASHALLTFLLQSARNVGGSARSGVQIVDHIAGILSTRDPEPGAPFAVIGPSLDAWVTLLHGPVQLWDGARWLAPTPHPGWLRSDVRPLPAVAIGPAGSPSPQLVPDSPYDLVAGTVPGGGMILVPGARADTSAFSTSAFPTSAVSPSPPSAPIVAAVPTSAPPTTAVPASPAPDPARAAALPSPMATPEAPPTPSAAATPAPAAAPAPAAVPEGPEPVAPVAPVAPDGVRQWASLRTSSAAAMAPLPLGGAATPPGRPQVPGVRCIRDHFNHPAAQLCGRCGRAVTAGQAQTVGPRPALGVLIADDGSTYRLDVDVVLGADPTTDPGVAEGRLRGVALAGSPGELAPTHAEIRLSGWTVDIVDRGSAGGTFVVPAGTAGWNRLTPYQPTVLAPGSHISLGHRVLTFVSPWPA